MATYNPTNPVTVGGAGNSGFTLKSQYDRVFDNTVALHDNFFGTQQFRGLRMHRKPQTLTRVMVTALDEIVMSDGYRYPGAGYRGLEATNTVVGAGGMDSGGVAVASTWYEIHAIAKSSDDTKNLLFHRACDFATDASQATGGGPGRLSLRTGGGTNLLIGQSFTVVNAGAISFIEVAILKNGTPTGNVWLELYQSSGGLPTGTALRISDAIDVGTITATARYIRFTFRTPLTVSAGQVYHFALNADYALSGVNNLTVDGVNTNPYAGGQASTYDGATWTAQATVDNRFTVYVTRNDNPITSGNYGTYLPSGYDRWCKLGYCYFDVSTNINVFWSQDKEVELGGIASGTFTNTEPDLFDVRAILPPTALTAHISVANSAAGNLVAVAPPDRLSNSIGGGAKVAIPGVANSGTPQVRIPPVVLEGQRLYAWTNAGTAQLWYEGYRW